MKKENAITLVALILTIIVLIILAGITISQLSNNGIFEKAKEAKSKWQNAQEYEETQIARYSNEIDNIVSYRNSNIGTKILDKTFIKVGEEYTLKESITGYNKVEVVIGANPNSNNDWWYNSSTMYVSNIIFPSESSPINTGLPIWIGSHTGAYVVPAIVFTSNNKVKYRERGINGWSIGDNNLVMEIYAY